MNVTVKIFASVAEELCQSSLRASPNEMGGVLVGTRSHNDNSLEYNILGALAVSDYEECKGIYVATPTKFTCTDRNGWANLALKAVETYGMSYLGDWHSHPQSSTTILSSKDIDTLVQQYKLGQFDPFPPLHILMQWNLLNSEIHITANIMLNNNFIVVVNTEVISK